MKENIANNNLFRAIPSVDQLLQLIEKDKTIAGIPRTIIKEYVNEFLNQCRKEIRDGQITTEDQLDISLLKLELINYIRKNARANFRRVINATGVVVHTNLGRSLLAEQAIQAVRSSCEAYSNLEFSLKTGKRGSRYELVEDLLCDLTGAEAGLVVNNNAAAVLLMLDTLAKEKEVIVSRGELVEIGGSFRIPEVMAKSGAILKEVGATNRTHLYDYERAIGSNTGALLKAHTSNYRIVGFHKEVTLKELVQLGQKYNLPVLEDLGSGNFFEFPDYVGIDEPTVPTIIRQGVSVVSFSGDKLLGGPQAGVILGKKEYIEKIKKNPLNRAVRIDKMTLAALEETLRLYKDPEIAKEKIPTLHMICSKPQTLKDKASRLARKMKQELRGFFEIFTKLDSSRVGGGASPELDIPTYVVCLQAKKDIDLENLRDFLLQTDPPLVGRVEHDQFIIDLRTIRREEISEIVNVFRQAVKMFNKRS